MSSNLLVWWSNHTGLATPSQQRSADGAAADDGCPLRFNRPQRPHGSGEGRFWSNQDHLEGSFTFLAFFLSSIVSLPHTPMPFPLEWEDNNDRLLVESGQGKTISSPCGSAKGWCCRCVFRAVISIRSIPGSVEVRLSEALNLNISVPVRFVLRKFGLGATHTRSQTATARKITVKRTSKSYRALCVFCETRHTCERVVWLWTGMGINYVSPK